MFEGMRVAGVRGYDGLRKRGLVGVVGSEGYAGL